MIYAIIFLPLLGSILSGFGGNFFGHKGSGRITTMNIFLTLLIILLYFPFIGLSGNNSELILGTWINTELFHVSYGFLFDSLTITMLVVVCSISTLVHLYSLEYMSHDPHLPRFMSYLSLFTFFMIILVTANNFLQMFIGWEGVGLCSYLLINFWFTRIQANKAAIKAMLMNRIGDFGLALAIFSLLYTFGTLDYLPIFSTVSKYSFHVFTILNFQFPIIDIIGLLLFIGAVGKSAQLGLHTWLPDAMEGPTPVSALIHAATMVTAGVFLIARCSSLFEHTNYVLSIITIMGSLTAFFAATTGLVQNDLKKVIAYSTCSQLGYMIFACGVSNYSVAIFHLANHAFFKALLFLGAGSVIHGVGDEQDMRKMGGLKRIMPFTYAMILIGSLALMGFPFLSGFYSKDIILEATFAKYNSYSHFAYYLGTFSAFCTAFYSIRLLYLTFLSETNGYRLNIINAHESNWKMLVPLAILAIPSIFIGFLTKDFFIGLGTDFWGLSIFILPYNYSMVDAEFISYFYKLLPLSLSLFGAILAYVFYTFFKKNLFLFKLTNIVGRSIYTFLNRKWYIDRSYNEIFTQKILNLGHFFTYNIIDRGLIEIFGPFGFTQKINFYSKKILLIHSGQIYHYAFIIFFSTMFLIIFIIFFSSLFNSHISINLIIFYLCIYLFIL